MAQGVGADQKPCIWMMAGVINIKFCYNRFDYAGCEFDRAMTAAAARNQASWQAGIKPEGKKAGIVFWQEKMRQQSGPEQMCRHMLTGRVPAKFCRRNYLCHNCAFDQLLEDELEVYFARKKPPLQEVFGIEVPVSEYLHRGHTWVALENSGRVRIGLDDFSQKVLGPANKIKLPCLGDEIRADNRALTLSRQGYEATVLAPLDGIIEAVNPNIRQSPGLAHDDPYGQGWLLVATPTNLQPDLEKLHSGQDNVAWMEHESHRLLGMLESTVGVALPTGGVILDDVYGSYPQLGWTRLVQEFLHST